MSPVIKLYDRSSTVDRRSSRRVNPADIRVTWLSPCVSSPALHPDNGQVRVIGSIDDVQMQQYVVDTAAQVLKYLSRWSRAAAGSLEMVFDRLKQLHAIGHSCRVRRAKLIPFSNRRISIS